MLLIVLSLIYLPDVGHGFMKDDFAWIAYSDLSSASRLFLDAPSGFYRPMVSLSFGVNRRACGAASAMCYGATNFALLVACAAAVFGLGRALSKSSGAAMLAAAIWAFNWHGINMAVLWTSGRTALLLVLFAAAAGAAFVRGKWIAAAALLAGALLTKEEAVLLPGGLLAWFLIDRKFTRSVPERSAWSFAASAVLVECAYFLLRRHSGAFTPASAPDFYRLSFSAARLLSNAPEYFDRAATFAIAAGLAFWLLFRPRAAVVTPLVRTQIAFGVCWFVAGLAITVFLPVRSSLYAVMPSVGTALIIAGIVDRAWHELPHRAQRRAVVIGVITPLVLWPVYHARNRTYVRTAELAARVVAALQQVARSHGAGAAVVLTDDLQERPSLDAAFGTLVQAAADLAVRPPIRVWIHSAGSTPPADASVRLRLEHGQLVPN
jgi:hypothetical protein